MQNNAGREHEQSYGRKQARDLVELEEDERKKVAEIIKSQLDEHFSPEEMTFDVEVAREFDDYGDGDGSPYLHIYIVFDGDIELLKTPWTPQFVTSIGDTLIEHGIMEGQSSISSFCYKSDWDTRQNANLAH